MTAKIKLKLRRLLKKLKPGKMSKTSHLNKNLQSVSGKNFFPGTAVNWSKNLVKMCFRCGVKPFKWFVLLILLLFSFLFLIKFLGWMICFGIVIALLGAVIFIFHKKDKSIPYVSSFLRDEYFKTKFGLSVMRNKYAAAKGCDANIRMHANDANNIVVGTRHYLVWRWVKKTFAHGKIPLNPPFKKGEKTNADNHDVVETRQCLVRGWVNKIFDHGKIPLSPPFKKGEKMNADDHGVVEARHCLVRGWVNKIFTRGKTSPNPFPHQVRDRLLPRRGKIGVLPLGKGELEGVVGARGKECFMISRIQVVLKVFFLKIRIVLNRFYLKFLHYLILLTKNSKEGFEILREELQEHNGRVIKVVIKNGNKKELVDIDKITKRIKDGHVKGGEVLDKIIQELFKLHREKQKKAAVFSFAGMSVIIITTVVSSLLMTTIFPNVFRSNAASYTWTQTDWSAGANAATTGHPAPSNWNKFASATNIDNSTSGEAKLSTANGSFSETFTGTTYKDAANTTANWNTGTGQVEFPSESMGTSFYSKLNGILGGSIIYAQVDAGDDVYIGAGGGKFVKYNKGTDTVTDLSAKISQRWNSTDIYALAFDSVNKVVYLGGYAGVFSRYNTPSYTGGGTYPAADTNYSLSSNTGGRHIHALSFDSSNNIIYIAAEYGKFTRYNTTSYAGGGTYSSADTAYDLTSKISSFWSTSHIYSLSFDLANKVIYIGGQSGKLARYNTASYTAGGTYPDADTAYNLTSKISSFWSYQIYSLPFDSVNNVIYLGGLNGKFARYNTTSYTAGGTYPDADTAYDLTSKVNVGVDIRSMQFDSFNNVIYLVASSSFFRYNTTSYTGGGTYPAADTGYSLSSKISSFWGTVAYSLCFDSTNNVIYLAGGSTSGTTRFARYNSTSYTGGGTYPTADTAYNLSPLIVGADWGANPIYTMVYAGNNEIYFGGYNGKFAKYNTETQTVTNLTSKISTFWGTMYIYSLSFDSINNVIYLGGMIGEFARYNTTSYTAGGTYPTADTAYNLTSKISSFWGAGYIYSLSFDSVNNIIYLGGEGSRLVRYNTTSYTGGGTYPTADIAYNLNSKISSFWGTNTIKYLSFNPANNVIYLGGSSGEFARYNTTSYIAGGTYPTADTAYDLTSKISSFWSTTGISSLSFDSSNKVIYLGGYSGKFALYNTTSYTGGGVYPTADTAYDLTSKMSSFWGTTSPYSDIYSSFFDPSANVIYLGGGYNGGKFARYSIASDTAIDLRSPDTISFWGYNEIDSFCINPTTGNLYIGGYTGNFAEKSPIFSPSFAQSLTLDSVSPNIWHATLTKHDTPGTGAITYYLSNNGGADWLSVTPGSEVAFATAGSDLRFKIGVTSGATVQDVSINYLGAKSGNIVSSAYNTSSGGNMMARIAWTENLPSGTDLKFQIRTASTADGLSSAEWLGPTGTEDFYTNPLGTEIMNSTHADGLNDQWFQYKAFFTSDGIDTPVLSDITLTYVVNAPPQVRNATASQGSDGRVNISYEVLDPDTSSGSPANKGHITPSFQYWNGSSWITCTTMAAGDTDQKSVDMDNTTWTSYTATWTPTTDYANHFLANTCKIRVTANDGEAANATGYNDSSTFTLDTKAPASASIKIDARTNPATLTLSATDDSSMQMKVSTTLHGGTLEDYATSKTISLETDPDTIYVDFIDPYGNMTNVNATTPETPQNFIYRDVTNIETSDYQIFIAWKEIPEPPIGFKQYNIYAKENDGEFSLIDTVNARATNYYVHQNLNPDITYSYKITAQTNNDDISSYTSNVSDKPNGQGGTDVTAPTISNVQSSGMSTTQATITWDTDEISSSTVLYLTETGGDFSAAETKTENGMKDDSSGLGKHQVILTGLTPGTDYYYKVKSSDPFGNIASSTQGVNGYTFTTLAGPVISDVTASDVNNNSATITWNTDIDSDSYVVYSTNSQPTGDPAGADTLMQAHAVGLSGLNQGTKYYYYVKSRDGSENLAQDNNGGAYYTFTTTADTDGPVISSISAQMVKDTSAMISWLTDENATSKVWLGTVSGTYATSTSINTNLDMTHAVKVENLTANTTYYYIVVSKDGSNNTSTSTEQNFATLEKLSTETQVTERETTAKSQGMAEQKANTTGGGVMIIDKTDKTAPIISNVKASNIKSDSAEIGWETDENANGFVEYGEDTGYGTIMGHYTTTVSHLINLKNLQAEKIYHYRIASMDTSGNLAQSQDQTFTTLSKTEEEIKSEETQKQEEQKTEAEKKNEKLFNDIEALADPNKGLSKEEIFVNAATAAQKAMDVLKSVSGDVSIETAEKNIFSQYENLQDLANIIPAPLMSGEPRVITTATTAIITWRTDRESNSLVALAPDGAYKIAQDRDNPYIEVRGNREDKTKEHVVSVYDLEPESTYHYQLRSQGEIGPMAKSSDFAFKTKNETLEISNYAVQNLSNEKVVFKWVTNLETDSEVKYIPYRDNKLMVEEAKTVNDKAMSIIHQLEISDFEAGVIYNVELSDKDLKGQVVTKEIPTYSTSKDDLPPIIYQVQTDSALSPGKDSRVQTIVSWQTNEPSTSRVYFAKGIAQRDDEFTEKTQLDNNFGKKHVVIITKFDQGSVYSFKVESSDSGGNASLSKIYTILTPRQRESVFQVIMKNLEQTFGWVSKIKSP